MSTADWDLLSSYAGLLTLASLAIYTGSFGSLKIHKPGGAAADVDDDEEEDIPERIGSGDAYLFPIIGSAVLFGLYLVVKYLGKEWVNYLLQWYFAVAGIGSVGKTLISATKWSLGRARWNAFEKYQLLFLKGPQEIISISLRTPSLVLLLLGAIPSILYNFGPSTTRRSALLTDVLGLSFAHNALSLLKIDSFKTGCVLLSGLFLYDIWWVFGTEVMVKVATNLDVPIKILWPKSLVFSSARGFTMLGLGDIVVPGMFIALALRYDYHRSKQSSSATGFSKPYFIAAMIAYVAGLATTMAVMHIFKAAQPALLYLSPACILSFVLTALVRGEFGDAWTWSDDPEHKEDDKPSTTDSTQRVTSLEPSAQGSELSEEAQSQEDGKLKKRRVKKS